MFSDSLPFPFVAGEKTQAEEPNKALPICTSLPFEKKGPAQDAAAKKGSEETNVVHCCQFFLCVCVCVFNK